MNLVDRIFDGKFKEPKVRITTVPNDDNLDILGRRLDKVRILLQHEREYGNDWRINYWTVVEKQLKNKWDMLVLEQQMNTLSRYDSAFEMGSAEVI